MNSSVIRFTKDSDYVSYVNDLLNKHHSLLSDQHIPLGQDFTCFDNELATEALQLHRFINKFEIPSDELSSSRALSSLMDMLSYDASGITAFNPGGDKQLSVSVRHFLYNAKRTLSEIVRSYSFSISNLELTSGETYVSARGDTSVYAKLRDLKQWTVTVDCFDLAARLFYNSPMLRNAVKHHFKKWFFANYARMGEFEMTPKQAWNLYNETLSTVVFDAGSESYGKVTNFTNREKFDIFRHKLRKLVTFVPGARLTTVPKNNQTDRVIECECWLNMLVQRTIGISIKKLIKKHFEIDLERSQDLHGKLISDLTNTTIDLKNASNSNWLAVVNWMLEGTLLSKHLNQSRCGLVEYKGEWHRMNMLSPNGNGFTFEVMTLMLLTVGREFDSFCHVYGDDIIIDADVAPCFIETVEYMGYKINTSKTFLTGSFRESCGSFFCEGYITSYDLHYAEDIVDAIILTNKVGIMGNTTNSKLASTWLNLHYELLEHCPRNLLRGFDFRTLNHSNLGLFVPDLADGILIDRRRLVKLRNKDPLWKAQHANAVTDHLDLILDLNYKPSSFSSYRYVKKVSKTYRDVDTSFSLEDVGSILGWFFIWSGRAIAPPLRDTILKTEYRITFL